MHAQILFCIFLPPCFSSCDFDFDANEGISRLVGSYAVSIPLDLDADVMESIGGDFVNMPSNPDYGDNKSA